MARKPSAGLEQVDLFEEIGGFAKCRELSVGLYSLATKDPALRHFFPGKSHKCAIEEFSAFLAQFLGGPARDAQRRWWLSLRESHLRFHIGQKERNAWLMHMAAALETVDLSKPMRDALRRLFEDGSAYLVNSGPVAAPKGNRKAVDNLTRQIACRWEEQRAVDDMVSAVRERDLTRVLAALASSNVESCFRRNRSMFAAFVGVLLASGQSDMSASALRILRGNADLAHETYSGRSLLHAAAAVGDLPMVAALLEMGVDAGIKDSGRHTPLYSVGNQCSGGAAVVKALVRHGAAVNVCDGVKRCTPLHMAARRGNVEAASALLDCGANIEARDSLGETPLRRAVNCQQIAVAALLLARGADPHSVGSKGLTPLSAMRGEQMREVMKGATKSVQG